MRKYFIPTLAALAWLLVSAGTAWAKPSAPITDVLLYPGGATIVRTVQVSPGMNQAVISGLPSAFDMQTLHAEAGAGIRIGEIVSNDVASTRAVNPAEATLERKITALRDKLEQLDAEAKAAQMAVDYLVHLMASSGTRADEHHPAQLMDAKTLTGLATAMRTEAGKSLARLQQIAVQKREITRNIDALQRNLNRLQTGGTDTRALTINFTATHAGVLRVSYQVSNAGWRPAYRASLNSDTSKVELERHAIISQKTGEDWSNVRLTLSTSQPRLATSGVDPQPWLLSYAVAGARGGYMAAAPMAAPAPMAAEAQPRAKKSQADKREGVQDNGEEIEEDTYTPPTFETQGMFATEFEVPARTSLPSDGREVSVELTRQDIPVKQYFQTVPRQEAAVYVTAEADMPQGDWPAGNMQLFRNGSYVGSGAWYPQAKDKLVLSFGRDEQVRVSVIPVKTDAASSGIISKRRQKKIATIFSFVNLHQQPIELRVLEASPVSTSDEISVRTEFAPKPTREAWDDKRGVVAWEMKLAPKGTAKIKADYEIDYPNEGELVNQR